MPTSGGSRGSSGRSSPLSVSLIRISRRSLSLLAFTLGESTRMRALQMGTAVPMNVVQTPLFAVRTMADRFADRRRG